MNIDIISYTAAQYAALTAEQLQEIRSAQIKKNNLYTQYQSALQEEKSRLTKNGTLLSSLWLAVQQSLYSDYQKAVENLREGLLFYLHYSSKANVSDGEIDAPYMVDYALSELERTQVVKTYYLQAYSDANQRFEVFEQDKVAPQYLGELYASLYEYFLSLKKQTT